MAQHVYLNFDIPINRQHPVPMGMLWGTCCAPSYLAVSIIIIIVKTTTKITTITTAKKTKQNKTNTKTTKNKKQKQTNKQTKNTKAKKNFALGYQCLRTIPIHRLCFEILCLTDTHRPMTNRYQSRMKDKEQ